MSAPKSKLPVPSLRVIVSPASGYTISMSPTTPPLIVTKSSAVPLSAAILCMKSVTVNTPVDSVDNTGVEVI